MGHKPPNFSTVGRDWPVPRGPPNQLRSFSFSDARRSRLSGAPAPAGRTKGLARRAIRRISTSSGVGGGVKSLYSSRACDFGMCCSASADDHDSLLASERPADRDLVAGVNLTMRLGGLPVDVDLTALAGLLRFRSRLEQARDVEPQIQPHRVIV